MNFKNLTSMLFSIILTASVSQALTWKGLFIAGDDSIDNFDHGRIAITEQFSKRGSLDTIQLSSSAKFISEEKSVFAATAQNIGAAFNQLKTNTGEACLVHMTSHGAKHQGFYLSMVGILSPTNFEKLLNDACGTGPAVVLISACYSGQFITESIKSPNRVILTAASSERPSFGCSADTVYTYWDECVLQELPKSKKWTNLYTNVQACISQKEKALGANPSLPQAYFGENTKAWEILH